MSYFIYQIPLSPLHKQVFYFRSWVDGRPIPEMACTGGEAKTGMERGRRKTLERDEKPISEYIKFEVPVRYFSRKAEQALAGLNERSELETKFGVYNWTLGAPGNSLGKEYQGRRHLGHICKGKTGGEQGQSEHGGQAFTGERPHFIL